ncbi:hypothetical protein CA235_10130 [Sphingomonas sp. ABOLF]|nr:hypothetical protein CA235_10130 [Sphingomonas sp. ABOLF]
MAGVFAPATKHRIASGGGKGDGGRSGGAMIGLAAASMFPKANMATTFYRPSAQTKRAFGGSSQAAVSGRAIATMERTARRVPEVMVRITGRQHGGGHVLANFSYISRLDHGPDKELGLRTSEGDVIHDGREMQKLAQEWQEWEMGDDVRRKGATSLSMILSMPSGTDPVRVEAAALDFAREEFANRSWVASLHVDRDHPHVHLTIARRDHDGRRFHPNRDDLFRYRQRFAEKLRDHGIEANATPAKARGIDPRHEPIAARKVREKGGVPRLDKSRAERADRYQKGGRTDPVDRVLSDQRATVRAAYEQSIAELSASPSMVNQMVAKSLQRFVDGLPEPEPNSIRAVQTMVVSREAGGRPASSGRFDTTAAKPDDLEAALGRLRAARAPSEADRSTPLVSPHVSGGAEPARQPGLSDRLVALMEKAQDQSTTELPDKTADALRQVRERDRAHRERDRSPEKGSPRR